MEANKVLDRLAALLDAATHGPWDRIRSQDYAYIVALHEAAPALIRLARAHVSMVAAAQAEEAGTKKHSAQEVEAMVDSLDEAVKALGEVRL